MFSFVRRLTPESPDVPKRFSTFVSHVLSHRSELELRKESVDSPGIGLELGSLAPSTLIAAVVRLFDSWGGRSTSTRWTNWDCVSLADIGRHFGVSRERARQLEARALRKVKDGLARSSLGADL
jgi:Sigma-70, region 4